MDKVGELQAQLGFPELGRLEKHFTNNLIYSQIGFKKKKKWGLEIGIG